MVIPLHNHIPALYATRVEYFIDRGIEALLTMQEMMFAHTKDPTCISSFLDDSINFINLKIFLNYEDSHQINLCADSLNIYTF